MKEINIRQTLDLIQPDAMPQEVEALLPAESSDALDAAIMQVSTGTPTELEIVNSTVREAKANNGATNHPPSIAGTPLTAVVQDQLYEFVPAAADPDGDPLVFSVSNLPTWASFSSTF